MRTWTYGNPEEGDVEDGVHAVDEVRACLGESICVDFAIGRLGRTLAR